MAMSTLGNVSKEGGQPCTFMSRLHFWGCARKACQHLPDGSGLILSETGVDRPAHGAPHTQLTAAVRCCLTISRSGPSVVDAIAIPNLKREKTWLSRASRASRASRGRCKAIAEQSPGTPQPVVCLSRRRLVG
jgi:hypothetical protein